MKRNVSFIVILDISVCPPTWHREQRDVACSQRTHLCG